MTTDPTNTARQARFRKARALGYEHVSGYLPPKRAATVRQWLAEADAGSTKPEQASQLPPKPLGELVGDEGFEPPASSM